MKEIPCPHESGLVSDRRQSAPDHHPLTREEIAALLDEAKGSNNPLTSQIQIRLCQGIPGYECPRLIDGPIAEKQTEIDDLYMENYRNGSTPELVEQFYTIMNR